MELEPAPAEQDFGGVPDGGVQATQPRRSRLFVYHAVSSAVILLVAVTLRAQQAVPSCADKLNDGHWQGEDVWQPKLCTLHHFTTNEVESCGSKFSQVVVIGAEKWASAAHLLCPTTAGGRKKTCEMQYIGQSNTCAENGQVVLEYNKLAQSPEGKGPVLVVHQPLFHLLPLENGPSQSEALSKCRGVLVEQVKAQYRLLAARRGSLVVQLDPHPLWQSGVTESGVDASHIYREMYNSAQHNTSHLLYLTSAFETGFSHRMISATAPDTVPPELSLVLNTFCSPLSSSPSSSSLCCVHTSHYFTITILVFIIASYVGVGLILLSGATFALIPHLEAVNFNLDRCIAILHSVGGGAFIFLYILMVDGLGYFQSLERSYSLVMFGVCVLGVVIMATLTSQQTNNSEMLSADQANAWRGTLVLTYLSLQYWGLDQVVAGRLFGELLVGGLVFISGYTHFSYYWKHSHFTWRRIGYVLFRINLLPLLLSLTLGLSYGVYRLPILLSLGFLFTSAFMASWPQMTPASLQGMSVQGPQHVVVAVKFGFAFLFISFLPWIKGLLRGLASQPMMGWVLGSGADVRTLYHWIYSQRYMTLGGMVFGYVICSVQSSNSVATASSDGLRKLRVVTIPFSLLILLGYGIFLVSATNFEQTSESQSLISQPVIISIALLCFFSQPLRGYESEWLTKVGSSTVWLFVAGQHILLNQGGSRLLVLFPSVPQPLNFALTLCVFFFCLSLIQFAQRTLAGSSYSTVTHPSSATQSNSRTLPLTT